MSAENTVELASGGYRASISLLGGGLRELSYGDEPLVHGYPDGEPAPLGAGQLLTPWPNRTSDGLFNVDGTEYHLEITEPQRNTAIHGLVRDQRWEVVNSTERSVMIEHTLGDDGRWPWKVELAATWSLSEAGGLTCHLVAHNTSDSLSPLGVGWHPYLTAFGAPLDECTLHLPVSTTLPLDSQRNLPAGLEYEATRVLPQLAEGQPMAGIQLDHCFGGLHKAPGETPAVEDLGKECPKLATATEGAASSTVRLENAAGRAVELWASESFNWYQVFTADPALGHGFPGVGRALAVEPMTCPPNALRSSRDLIRLYAGEARAFDFGIRARG